MDQYDGLLHVPTINILTNSPSDLPVQTSTAGTNDFHTYSEKRDDSGAICDPLAVSPAIVEEMTKTMSKQTIDNS